MKHFKLEKLLDGSPQSFYWLGFIMADGHISENRLTIGSSIKDKGHLDNFSNYINHGVVHEKLITSNFGIFNSARISVMDCHTIPKIRKMFNLISTKKTYEPITLDNIQEMNIVPFFIGYIDGDGTINKQTNRVDSVIRLHIHSSWLPVLLDIKCRLERILNLKISNPKITKDSYCSWVISNSNTVIYLKKSAIDLKLPVLNRKWDKIDINYVSRYTTSIENLELVKSLLNKGYRNKDIVKELNCSPSYVSNIIRKHGLKYLK